jgi:hypothetical protein
MEPMHSALVSVVIPAYNQAAFVGEAIQSVLDQTYSNFEIILVNDASLDHTNEVVKQFDDPRLRYIVHEKNLGLPAARNTGILASTGEIVALLDADDLFHPEKLKAHVHFLDKHPEVGVTYNARFELNHSAKTIRELWRPPLTVGLLDLALGFPFAPSDMVLRREWFSKVGLFDLKMGSAEDTDLPCRLALAGCKFASVDRTLNYRRYHSSRGRKNLPGRLNDVARALEAVFADPRCPDEVRAIQDIAIKHHLMVIVSLALIQGETGLAQKYARELVRIVPSTLEGTPCELLDFLLTESIADENINHELLLQRIFSQLPPEVAWLSVQYDWTVARGYLWKGTRAVMWDRPEDGRAHFSRAAELHAEMDEPFVQLLTQHLLNYGNEFGEKAVQRVLQKLSPCLKQVGGFYGVCRLKGSLSINRAFQKYHVGEYTKVPRLVMQAMASDPRYLINRGVVAILLRSMAGSMRQPSNQ